MRTKGLNPVSSLADPDIDPGDMELRIVIADDEPLARQLLSRLVRGQPGLSVVGTADDGESALRSIRETRPDLVFLDIRMPRRSSS
jgi:two-component system LytT family response regulator